MPIVDQAGNALAVPTTSQMLGYTEPADAAEVLNLNMYDFLIEPIRKADTTDGKLFVKRFLEGPQAIWKQIQSDIFRIKDLWDIFRIPDEFLVYLKWILGWVRDTDRITDKLSADQLRKLLASSAPLWKRRGSEEAYADAILLIYATRLRVWNWFDLRWILNESILGQNHQGRDVSILSAVDQRVSNLRIMDQDGIDHELIGDIVRLFRPGGERVLITYLQFLDQFDQGNSQWSEDASTPVSIDDESFTLHSNDQVALDFSAGSDRADWANEEVITSNARTIVMRIRLNTVGATQRLLTINDDSLSQEALALYVTSSNTIGVREVYTGNDRLAESFTTVAGVNWHWVAVRIEAGTTAAGLHIYVDEVVETPSYPSTSDATGSPNDVDGTLSLGGRTQDNTVNLNGMIADVRMWNALLTEAELDAEFRSVGAAARTDGLFFAPDFSTLTDTISQLVGTLNSGAVQVDDQAPAVEVFLPDVDGSDWGDMIAYARVRGYQNTTNGRFGLVVRGTDLNNNIRVGINIASNAIQIEEWVGGSQSVLASGVVPFPLSEGVWYGLRVEIVGDLIQAYLENNLVVSYNSGLTLTSGVPGVFHSQHAIFECSELEQFPLPIVDDYIDINS